MSNSSIWPIDRTLSGATNPDQSGPGSDGNKGVIHIPQNSIITEASPSDCLVSYPEHSLGRGVLPLCSDAVGVFYNPSRLSQDLRKITIKGNILFAWIEINSSWQQSEVFRHNLHIKYIWRGVKMFAFFCFFCGISILLGYLTPKLSLPKNSGETILLIVWGCK